MRLRSAPAISCTRSSKRRLSSFSAWSRASRQAKPASANEANAVTATVAWRTARSTSTPFLPIGNARHLAPAAPGSRGPLPQPLQAPERGELPIAEVLDHRDHGELEEVAALAIDMVRDLFQEERAHRQQRAER